MTTHKLYPKHDPSKLEPHYCEHVSGMAEWGLHAKSDIAIQLAWRDARIAELEASVERLKRYAKNLTICDCSRTLSPGRCSVCDNDE
jgi:hypothetical protein